VGFGAALAQSLAPLRGTLAAAVNIMDETKTILINPEAPKS
jgi:hypothetical protein